MNRYRLLLCDADNTLFDFDQDEKASLFYTLKRAGMPQNDQVLHVYSRLNDAQWKAYERGETTQEKLRVERFSQLLAILGSGKMTAQAMEEMYSDQLGKNAVLYPGALAFVQGISQHMPIVLVTNGIASIQHEKLDLSPAKSYIKDIFISEEIGASKPDPKMLLMAMEKYGVTEKSQVLLMGDSQTADIAAANNAGIDSLLFRFGQEEAPCAPATYFAGSFARAREIVLG